MDSTPKKLHGDQDKLMSFHHRILAGLYQPLRLARFLGQRLGAGAGNCLRVLMYHDIPPGQMGSFEAQLRWLARSWRFVSPDRFAAMVDGLEPVRGRNLLVSFDDGFASNRRAAEEVLNPMGIRAIFFIVSEFADLNDPDEARLYISRHIIPGYSADDLPTHLANMNWADIASLMEAGHAVGAHTRSHARLSRIADAVELEDEIVASADLLEKRLGASVDHFAYPFGDMGSISQKAVAVASRRFRYVYSALRGDNCHAASPHALCRDGVYADSPLGLAGAFLEGAADFRYARQRKVLEQWAARSIFSASCRHAS